MWLSECCMPKGSAECHKPARVLIAVPVYNEQKHVQSVLERVLEFAPPNPLGSCAKTGEAPSVLVIDDGSKDATPTLLAGFPVEVIRHSKNRGYGRSMQDAFRWAAVDGFDWVITMDCDEQHEPAAIPRFVEAIVRDDADVISGSRYMPESLAAGIAPPPDRRAINAEMTAEINARLGPMMGLSLTDTFCGFKAYRVSALKQLDLDVDGYAFPMQFWVQAVAHGLRIREIAVKLIYNDLKRTFGGPLNDATVRLGHYREVLNRELTRCERLLSTRRSKAAASV